MNMASRIWLMFLLVNFLMVCDAELKLHAQLQVALSFCCWTNRLPVWILRSALMFLRESQPFYSRAWESLWLNMTLP